MKLSKEKRDRLLLIAVVTLAVLVALWYGVIKTRLTQLDVCRSNLGKAKEKLAQAEGWLKKSAGIEDEMEAAVKTLTEMESRMASSTDPYSWSWNLLQDQAKAGHAVEIVDVTRPQIGDVRLLSDFPYSAAIFTVRGVAYFHDFGRFLADFENKYPYFRAQNLLLSASADSSGNPASARRGAEQLAFKMDIVALVKPNP